MDQTEACMSPFLYTGRQLLACMLIFSEWVLGQDGNQNILHTHTSPHVSIRQPAHTARPSPPAPTCPPSLVIHQVSSYLCALYATAAILKRFHLCAERVSLHFGERLHVYSETVHCQLFTYFHWTFLGGPIMPYLFGLESMQLEACMG